MKRRYSVKVSPLDELYPNVDISNEDVSDYQQELRSSRTLSLRQNSRNSLNDMFFRILPSTSTTSSVQTQENSLLLNLKDINIIDPVQSSQILTDGNEPSVAVLLDKIIVASKTAPQSLNLILENVIFLENLCNYLTSQFSEALMISVLQTISSIFPLTPIKDDFIDMGICINLFDLISSEFILISMATIQLIDTICDYSGYGRDAVICLGLHQQMMDLALTEINENLTNVCCVALQKIFANPDFIDSIALIQCVIPLSHLMALNSKPAVQAVIECYVEMTNKVPSLVYTLFDLELIPYLMNLLNDEFFIESVLKLLGNMSMSKPSQIQLMIDHGILNRLCIFIQTQEFSSDAFWVLSNMVESVPSVMIPLISLDLVNASVQIALNSPIEVKKEAAYFISTVVIFSDKSFSHEFMRLEIIDMLTEMLGCGVTMVSLRCLDTMVLLLHYATTGGALLEGGGESFLALLSECDVTDRLVEFEEEECPKVVKDRAAYLMRQIETLVGKAGA